MLVDLEPPLTAAAGRFTQTLHYANATILISAGPYTVSAWISGGVIRLEVNSTGGPFDAHARFDVWRNSTSLVPSYGGGPCGCGSCNKQKHLRRPDTLRTTSTGDVQLYHRNELRPEIFELGKGSLWESELRFAGLESAMPLRKDPLTNLTFGAQLHGESGEWEIVGQEWGVGIHTMHPQKEAVLAIHVISASTGTAEEYQQALSAAAGAKVNLVQAKREHATEWESIWARSFVEVLMSRNLTQDVRHTTSMYVATRYIALLEMRGGPKKFNGGILNPDLGALASYCTSVPPGANLTG